MKDNQLGLFLWFRVKDHYLFLLAPILFGKRLSYSLVNFRVIFKDFMVLNNVIWGQTGPANIPYGAHEVGERDVGCL